MIVAIAGRKQSGKSLVSGVLVDRGYTRFSFATFLKSSLSEVLGLPLADFYDEKAKEALLPASVLWDSAKTAKLSKLAGVEIPHYADREMPSIRSAMEYIGTYVLRRFDREFHVKKTAQLLDAHKGDAVIDDMRFPNEIDALKAIGARTFMTIRPFHTEYSNNPVESSVNWAMPGIDKVLANVGTKEDFFEIFKEAFDNPGSKRIHGEVRDLGRLDRFFIEHDTKSRIDRLSNVILAGLIAARGVTEKGILDEEWVSGMAKSFCGLNDIKDADVARNPFIIENLKAWGAVGPPGRQVAVPYQIAEDRALSTAFKAGVLSGLGLDVEPGSR